MIPKLHCRIYKKGKLHSWVNVHARRKVKIFEGRWKKNFFGFKNHSLSWPLFDIYHRMSFVSEIVCRIFITRRFHAFVHTSDRHKEIAIIREVSLPTCLLADFEGSKLPIYIDPHIPLDFTVNTRYGPPSNSGWCCRSDCTVDRIYINIVSSN